MQGLLSFGLAFDIEKSTNGQNADDPTGPHIEVGAPANRTNLVTNRLYSDISFGYTFS
jgi:hypothetical protein